MCHTHLRWEKASAKSLAMALGRVIVEIWAVALLCKIANQVNEIHTASHPSGTSKHICEHERL